MAQSALLSHCRKQCPGPEAGGAAAVAAGQSTRRIVERSMKAKVSLALAVGWALFTIIAMFLKIRESVTLIFLMSGYAIVVAHLAEWAGHRAEEENKDG